MHNFFLELILSINFLFFFPIFIILIIYLIPKQNIYDLNCISIIGSFFMLISSTLITFNYIWPTQIKYYFKYNNIEQTITFFNLYPGLDYTIQIYDSTLLFIILITLITFICNLLSLNTDIKNYQFIISLYFILEYLSIQFFTSGNLFFLFMYYEGTVIPTFILIGLWGIKIRKNIAFYYFYTITGFGSLCMLSANFLLYNQFNTLNTLEIAYIHNSAPKILQHFIWILLVLCFIIKLPGILFYNWLLEAHVQAPTEGSVILSGYILKYSIWGLFAHVYLMFPTISDFYKPLLSLVVGCSVIYSIYSLLRTHDLKKCIAYSSIAHMGIAFLGLIMGGPLGLTGCLLMTYSHSITSPGLFIIAGILYKKYNTINIRNIKLIFPLNFFFVFLTLSNIGFPGTINFISEILIFFSIFNLGSIINYLTINTAIFVAGTFYIWLLTKTNFNQLKSFNQHLILNIEQEIILIFSFTILILFGFFPNFLFYFTKDLVLLHFYIRL